ncbi:MAG TPA: DNA repair protein RadC [Halanaerobiaceae bacterium]|jgi:DNA repair protein RadC|nr:DNA repair protein RadC [Bacillota bacterium]HHU93100.1 DNA repair protein RadC [Halanaerobiaceae bacterium]HOA41163.1 DNA repair protein RadC [Halanaerobiales bacterium]HPZ63221.1 DNA repair protein RadC [Halanaerobiales bacterium]HQD04447.1 DNA repair protein RadC [Halanaerobiales bacterium]
MGSVDYRFTIKEMPADERPREKLIKYGAERLTDAELLALIIRVGNDRRTAVELSQDLINKFGGLKALNYLSINELKELKGIGDTKAAQIKAVVELGKRLASLEREERDLIRTPGDVVQLLMPELRYLTQEVFKVVLLDIKNQVIAIPLISKGGLSSSIVHPREVFKEAIKRSAAAMILVHNHPSGIPEPSREDINITKKLLEAGEVMGIDVLDHVIIGDGIYVSMRERGLI